MLQVIHEPPFAESTWPAHWVWAEHPGSDFEAVLFACPFEGPSGGGPMRVHVSADQRYKLYLDGELVGLGPARGDLNNWYFETYDLHPEGEGEHVLAAVVWHNRDDPPVAQMSVRPGFLVAPGNDAAESLATAGMWRYRRLDIRLIGRPYCLVGRGHAVAGLTQADLMPDADAFDQRFCPVATVCQAQDAGNVFGGLPWHLRPRAIDALEAEPGSLGTARRVDGREAAVSLEQVNHLLTGAGELEIPANSECRILIDTGVLTTGYPRLRVSAGADARLRLTYQEALLADPQDATSKGHRDEIEGRVMAGLSDEFLPDGRADVHFEPLWYRCWRYVELAIETADQPLTLHAADYRYTGYPLKLAAELDGGPTIRKLVEPGFRTLRLCAAEQFMDCPYYEQLQYVGDTRAEALLSYVLSGDDRLGRHAVYLFDQSRTPDGLTRSRYPSRMPQVIPTFSLWFIVMVRDLLMWRGCEAFVEERLVGVAAVLDAFERMERDDGLLGPIPNWPFVDWVARPTWHAGMPPLAREGGSYLINFQYLYTLQQASLLYRDMGRAAAADRCAARAADLQTRLREVALDPKREIFIDEPSGEHLSQHTNVLAILTDTHVGHVDGEALIEKIVADDAFARTTFYFSFYLFEAMHHVGRADMIWTGLGPWHEMLAIGLTTFAEKPEPVRSDCHAWSSHPLYHYFASILGVRPAAPGCREMTVRPASRPRGADVPDRIAGQFCTPHGPCKIALTAADHDWRIESTPPPGVTITPA